MSPASPGPELPSGTIIADRYVIHGRIGEGGMGEVYAAEHLEMGRRLAVKLVRPEIAADEANLERFRREARAASRIKSDHVVTVYDFGRDEATGRFYLAMELLEGETLADRIERERVLSPEVTIRISRAIAEALHAAHRAKVIHRDLKPENVFIETDGRVKVLDFGIARILDSDVATGGNHLTSMAMVVGTPAYINPEAAGRQRQVVDQSDLYSLGVIMFEMLVGRLPFDDPEPFVLIGLHLRAPPERVSAAAPNANVPPGLDDLVDKLLEKDPAERPPSARAVIEALDAIAASMTGAARSSPRAVSPPEATVPEAVPAARDVPVRSLGVTPPSSASAPIPGQSAVPSSEPLATLPAGSEARRAGRLALGAFALVVVAVAGASLLWGARRAPSPEPSVEIPPPRPTPQIQVEVPPPTLPIPVTMTHVTFAITPSATAPVASIELDGRALGDVRSIEVVQGNHVAVVGASGFASQTISFEAVGDHLDVAIELVADHPPETTVVRTPSTTRVARTRPPPSSAAPSHGAGAAPPAGLAGALRRIAH